MNVVRLSPLLVSEHLFDIRIHMRSRKESPALSPQIASERIPERMLFDEVGNIVDRSVDRDPRIYVR